MKEEQNRMTTDKLYNDPELAQFYDIENEWSMACDYVLKLSAEAQSVLDIGCGTGLLAATIAGNGTKRVTGVDPAQPMLDIAAGRQGGERVTWVRSDAASLDLGEKFDLIVLSGHAFQVFLNANEQLACLQTIARHLSPAGKFIFDSRNPATEEWREWIPEESRRVIAHPDFGAVNSWNDVTFDAQAMIVEYGTYYEVAANGKLFSSKSRIAFPSQAQIAALMAQAGLQADRWLGDWQGNHYQDTSAEIIPLGSLKADT